MLRFHNYDIVFQEIPDEVTLAINISNCPNHCRGCHSPHLAEDTGERLDEGVLAGLLEKYGNAVTCVCFMGGDGSPEDVLKLAKYVRKCTDNLNGNNPNRVLNPVRVGWYSGKSELYENAQQHFDYIKLGKYIEESGGLSSPTTNQRFYRIENEQMFDMTKQFYKQ